MNKRHSNLLTWRFRLIMLMRRRLAQWSVAWVAAVLISLVWWQLRMHRVSAADEQVALMETRFSPLQQMEIENQNIQQQLMEMNSHESLLTRLDDEQVPYRLLALVSMQVGRQEGTVRIESFHLEQTDSAGAPSGQQTVAVRELTQLTLTGIAADNLAVSLFVAGLRDTGVFETVDLKSSVGAHIDRERAQSFTIDCAF